MINRPSLPALALFFFFFFSSSAFPDQVYADDTAGYKGVATTLSATATDQPIADISSTSPLSSISTSIKTTTHHVDVGRRGLVFSPDSLTASIGDTINFHFHPRNHSVVQSRFDSPCVPLSGGGSGSNITSSTTVTVYSGFISVSEGEAETMFSITVNSSDPTWLYCSQGQHCQSGMTMVINPPTNGARTLEAYKQAAAGVQAAESPDTGVSGGLVLPSSEDGEEGRSGGGGGSSNSSSSGSSSGNATRTTTSTRSSLLPSPPPSSSSTNSTSPPAVATATAATGAAPASLVHSLADSLLAVGMLTVGLVIWTFALIEW